MLKRLRHSRKKQTGSVVMFRRHIADLMAEGGCRQAAAWTQLEVGDSEAVLPAIVNSVKHDDTEADIDGTINLLGRALEHQRQRVRE